jgi:Zn-dependent metalloprotease
MKKNLLFLLALTLYSFSQASSNLHYNNDPLLKTFITNNKWKPNEAYQSELRSNDAWTRFSLQNGNWWVQFNETNQKPHRAFGKPIQLNVSVSPADAALYFLNNYAADYFKTSTELHFKGTSTNNQYVQPNFIQYFQGKEVLFSRATVKMTPGLKVLMFGLDIYDDISLPTTATINLSDAIASATTGITQQVTKIEADPDLKILPIPQVRNNIYKQVYAITVSTYSPGETPSKYYTLVDAISGEVLYRTDRIESFANTDITTQATVYPTHPYNPTQVKNLQYIKVNSGGVDYYTDVNGNLTLSNTTTSTALMSLAGLYAQVYTGATATVLTTFTSVLNPGSNLVNFDPNTTSHHLTAYYHTNIVHDFMKTYFPTYTDLDFPMDVRVERTDGTCNAFYDGGLNFYTTAGGCYALSMVNDVVYHEYGHGITNTFWNFNGLTFQNGAMGEGYSDVWAMSITSNPVLGIGFSNTDSTTFVRDYDFANGVPRKVYPQNIVGEVHADGEIIAGAWWSTAINLGSVSAMTSIFAASHYGLANGPDGSEGQVYTDILIDALYADDNDSDLTNGTPNVLAIVNAFALHGITLLSTATLNHTPVATAASNLDITLNASLSNLQFAWALSGVNGAYKINNATTWNLLSFTNNGSNNYSATIPAQPNGTVVSYYLGLQDVNGLLSNVVPAGADASNPNIPYYIMIGYNLLFTNDFDANSGNWTAGLPSDNATTGIWEENVPQQTTTTTGGSPVQPGFQHTPGGSTCYVTGAQAGTGAGTDDVDNGKTTLISTVLDLSGYTHPAIEYYRWYSNDQGATPGTDFWQVAISNDGTNYIPVENTNVADHSWRRYVLRVNDYVSNSPTVTVRFIAEDANAGSLVEALVDDFSVYDEKTVGINEINDITSMIVYPNPANDMIKLSTIINNSGIYKITITNLLGQEVITKNVELTAGKQNLDFASKELQNGMYTLNLRGSVSNKTLKFSVFH